MRRLLVALVAAAALSRPGSADSAPGGGLWGSRIESLSFKGDGPGEPARWAALTDLQPGKVLTETAVRSSLRNLFATRRFLDLSVEAAPSDTGALVVIRFAAAPRIRSLVLVGNHLPERGRMRDLIGLDVGNTWTVDAAAPIEEALRQHLRARGYFEANVGVVVTGAEEGGDVDVRVDVVTGRRARTGPPDWNGRLDERLAVELEKAVRTKPDTPWRESRARANADRYAARLRKSGFARAEVRFEGARYDSGSNEAHAKYAVFVGPRVILRVIGAPESDVRKHPASPWAKGDPADEDAVRAFRGGLLRTYQEQGYAKAEIELKFETGTDEDTITFTIRKGARWAVGRVRIVGAQALKASQVRGALATSRPGLLTRGRLVEADLKADVESVTGLYRSKGFHDAKVEKPEVSDGKKPFTLDVTFRIVEGERYTVEQRRLRGESKLAEAALVKDLETVPGRPFDEARVNADVATIGGRYQAQGFVDARVEAVVTPATPGPEKGPGEDVTFSIFEGERVTFGKTIFRGFRKTHLSVLRRTLAHAEGEPFDPAKLLESGRNLDRLGVFSRVDTTYFPTDPETKSRTVVISVVEGKPWSLIYGAGVEYQSERDRAFSPRLSLGVSYNNLFGRAIIASGEVRWSRIENRAYFVLREPSILDSRMPLTFTALVGKYFQPGYEVKRAGAYLDTARQLSEHLRTSLRYQYELVQPSRDPGLGPDQRVNQKNLISSIGPGISWDRRDDPINPRSGWLVTGDVKWAFPFLAADAHFVRATMFASLYRPAGDSVLAFAFRTGAIQPLGSCTVVSEDLPVPCPPDRPNLGIPIPERLFLGGRTTHRAFIQDGLGIPGQTLDITQSPPVGYGGNFMMLFNAEWRLRVAGALGLTFFFDAGQVWADYRRVNFSQIRPGAGAGIQYLTPVGPLRLEYGVKLDKKPYESLGVLNFSVGYAF
jgi:outer membrane protein insertion porin family